jgi:6-phosphogluconate dehydrogenase
MACSVPQACAIIRHLRNTASKLMDIGMIGLGRMGLGLAQRLQQHGHVMQGYDASADTRAKAGAQGVNTQASVQALVAALPTPRTLWVMVPAGQAVDDTLALLQPLLQAGDVVVDGGNSNYKDTQRRHAQLALAGIEYVDCGTSGGVWGATNGFALMVGGSDAAVAHLKPAFEALAPSPTTGWGHVGPSGAGHFVKMVHNGIEYGLMQALGEGFAILAKKEEFGLDLPAVSQIWRHGSVVRSWLLDLTAAALAENPHMQGIAPHVSDSGAGRWTVAEAIDLNVAAPVITASLLSRIASRENDSFSDKLLSAMRNQFGGHEVKKT